MVRRWIPYNRMSHQEENSLHKLLGELEVQVMGLMWGRAERGEPGHATVRDIATELQQHRDVAYTTVMTVMSHLTDKGLLTRTPLDKKTYLYAVALSRDEFLQQSSQQMVDTLLTDFGDLALAQFVEAVEQVDPERLRRLLERLAESKPGSLDARAAGKNQGETTAAANKAEGGQQ